MLLLQAHHSQIVFDDFDPSVGEATLMAREVAATFGEAAHKQPKTRFVGLRIIADAKDEPLVVRVAMQAPMDQQLPGAERRWVNVRVDQNGAALPSGRRRARRFCFAKQKHVTDRLRPVVWVGHGRNER